MTYKGIEEVKMSKSNQVFLNQIFNDAMTFVSDVVSTSPTYTLTTGSYTYQPKKAWEYLDWDYFNNYSFKCTSDFIPSYPVSNYSIDKEGKSIIEIAITGFDEEEIIIEKRESKIIVKGKKKDKQKEDRKYLYKNIACRDFELEFQCSDSWDCSNIEAEIDKGVLTITIPVKEDCKPITIPIKKK
jgi:HSP20 family molecular chaperone IbpA